MSTRENVSRHALLAALLTCSAFTASNGCAAGAGGAEFGTDLRPSLGRPAPADYDSSASPDGTGLPAGSASVASGEAVYAVRCASCHGDDGRMAGNEIVGGDGSLAGPSPKKTVGSFWPHATTLFDYIGRAMPYATPGILTAEERYAVTGWVLHLNGIVEPDLVLDARSLPEVRMPNRDGFFERWRGDGFVER